MPKDKGTKKQRAPRPTPLPPQPTNPQSPYAPSQWGSSTSEGVADVIMPSGQLAQLRKPGVQGLMAAGVLHKIDSLTALVDQKHIQRVKGRPDSLNVEKLMEDSETIQEVLHTVDRVVCYAVVQPAVVMTPNDVTSRVQGVVYTDMIDIDDRMFIMNYAVGGTADAEQFRIERDQAMGNILPGENVEGVAQQPVTPNG